MSGKSIDFSVRSQAKGLATPVGSSQRRGGEGYASDSGYTGDCSSSSDGSTGGGEAAAPPGKKRSRKTKAKIGATVQKRKSRVGGGKSEFAASEKIRLRRMRKLGSSLCLAQSEQSKDCNHRESMRNIELHKKPALEPRSALSSAAWWREFNSIPVHAMLAQNWPVPPQPARLPTAGSSLSAASMCGPSLDGCFVEVGHPFLRVYGTPHRTPAAGPRMAPVRKCPWSPDSLSTGCSSEGFTSFFTTTQESSEARSDGSTSDQGSTSSLLAGGDMVTKRPHAS